MGSKKIVGLSSITEAFIGLKSFQPSNKRLSKECLHQEQVAYCVNFFLNTKFTIADTLGDEVIQRDIIEVIFFNHYVFVEDHGWKRIYEAPLHYNLGEQLNMPADLVLEAIEIVYKKKLIQRIQKDASNMDAVELFNEIERRCRLWLEGHDKLYIDEVDGGSHEVDKDFMAKERASYIVERFEGKPILPETRAILLNTKLYAKYIRFLIKGQLLEHVSATAAKVHTSTLYDTLGITEEASWELTFYQRFEDQHAMGVIDSGDEGEEDEITIRVEHDLQNQLFLMNEERERIYNRVVLPHHDTTVLQGNPYIPEDNTDPLRAGQMPLKRDSVAVKIFNNYPVVIGLDKRLRRPINKLTLGGFLGLKVLFFSIHFGMIFFYGYWGFEAPTVIMDYTIVKFGPAHNFPALYYRLWEFYQEGDYLLFWSFNLGIPMVQSFFLITFREIMMYFFVEISETADELCEDLVDHSRGVLVVKNVYEVPIMLISLILVEILTP